MGKINTIKNNVFIFIVYIFVFLPAYVYSASLTIKVSYPNGKPAKNISVDAYMLSRPVAMSKIGKTDKNGIIKYVFVDVVSINTGSFGYGTYRFVINKNDYACSISDKYYWNNKSDAERNAYTSIRYNGDIGKNVIVEKDDDVVWNVKLNKGNKCKIKAVDQQGKPLVFKEFDVSINLYAESHTGFGGAFIVGKYLSGIDGCFTIPNVNEFFYRVGMKPGRNDIELYIPGPSRTLTFEKMLHDFIEIKYFKPKKERFIIKIVDSFGKPVEGAEINARIDSFDGYYWYLMGKTNVNGIYIKNDFNRVGVGGLSVNMPGREGEYYETDGFKDGLNFTYEIHE